MRKIVHYIMAGGEGLRLRPLTDMNRPKPLLPIGKKRVIDFTLAASQQFENIVAGGYGFSQLENYLKLIKWNGLLIKDSGIIGFASLIEHIDLLIKLNPNLIIVSPADYVHFINYTNFIDTHLKSNAKGTVISIQPTSDPNHEICVDDNNKVLFYEEKTSIENLHLRHAIGVYCFEADYLLENLCNYIASPEQFDLTNIYRFAVKEQKASTFLYKNHWRDIGTLDRFYDENLRVAKSDKNIIPETSRIHPSSFLTGCLVMNNVKIHRNCYIKDSIIDDNLVIPEGVKIGLDIHQDIKRKIIVTPQNRRVISRYSLLP